MPAEILTTADGAVIDMDQAEQDFARAMAAPEPGGPVAPAPPKVDPDAPRGRKADGSPRRAPGRPAKARTTDSRPAAPAGSAAKRGAAAPADYAGPLAEFTSALWMVLAAAPVPGEEMRIRIRAQAKILRDNQPGLCQGVNLMAQHNATIRRGVEALTAGNAGWVLPAVMAVAPFAVQTAQLWRSGPEAGEQLAAMAADTDAEWGKTFAAMQAEMGLAPAGAEAEQLPEAA